MDSAYFREKAVSVRNSRTACPGTIRGDVSCFNWPKILNGAPLSLKRQSGTQSRRAGPIESSAAALPATGFNVQRFSIDRAMAPAAALADQACKPASLYARYARAPQ
jgi:hypothetical protein